MTIDALRRFAVNRNFPPPESLRRAIHRMGFVQADPIRAPARAQDLILRHRVKDYRAGDLERHYGKLGIEEDFFVVYGFVPKAVQALMHPRPNSGSPAQGSPPWPAAHGKTAQSLLEFVRERGEAHPRDVDAHFLHGNVTNFFGGSSNLTTQLLSAMHYCGMLRVTRRDSGTRVYSAVEHGPEPADDAERRARIDALVDVAAGIYAPMPSACLSDLVSRLRYGVPQWCGELKGALQRARKRLSHARLDGVDWYWPGKFKLSEPQDRVRLLAPFDPLVWDRDRFELLWGWVYRFEAYTPAPKRIRGYYALPLLWRDRVIGWANLSVKNSELQSEIGYVQEAPREAAFRRELEMEMDRMRAFLGLVCDA